jgi:hypothetical protein
MQKMMIKRYTQLLIVLFALISLTIFNNAHDNVNEQQLNMKALREQHENFTQRIQKKFINIQQEGDDNITEVASNVSQEEETSSINPSYYYASAAVLLGHSLYHSNVSPW